MALFKKTKARENLPEEDRVWAEKITSRTAGNELLPAALLPTSTRLKYLVDHFKIYNPTVFAALKETIGNGTLENAKLLLDCFGASSGDISRAQMTELYGLAARSGRDDAWKGLEHVRPKLHSERLKSSEKIRIAITENWQAGTKKLLQKGLNLYDAETFEVALMTAIAEDSPLFKDIVTFAPRFSKFYGYASIMNGALDAIARKGDLEKAALLLDSDPSMSSDTSSLIAAAGAGNHDMLDFLVQRTPDFSVRGHDVLSELRRRYTNAPLAGYLEELIAAAEFKSEEESLRAEEEQREKERFSLPAPHTLAEKMPLPSGGTLTVLFNFSTRQQIFLAETAGRPAAPAIVNFSDIESRDAIRRAGERIVAMKGDAQAVEEVLSKQIRLEK